VIDLGLVPLHPSVESEARFARERAELFGAKGGEDYELLAALPADAPPPELGTLGLTRIGRVEVGEPGRVILELDGKPVVLSSYDHFA